MPHQNPARTAPLLLALLFLAGCGTTAQVATDYDPSVDFTKYKTYSWHPRGMTSTGIPIQRAQFIQTHVKASVERELSLRGFKPATYEVPDFYIASIIGAVNTSQVQRWGTAEGGFTQGPSEVPVQESQVREGSIVLNLIDNQNGLPIWQSTAHGAVKEVDNAKMRERVEAVVKAMLAGFPPK
jgi:hypothetical protein